LTNNNRSNIEIVAQGKLLPSVKELSFMLLTFALTVFAWIFFRAENIGHSFNYISEIFSGSLYTIPEIRPRNLILLVLFFVLIEWLGREGQFAIQKLGIKWKRPIRYAMYYAIIIAIFWFGGREQQFIYFQF
jgi:D-alanyl-lipoteichoic acid acyltransferase DltB (MBOAT superfamily)